MSVNAKNEGSMGEAQTASSFTAEALADSRTQLQLRKKARAICHVRLALFHNIEG